MMTKNQGQALAAFVATMRTEWDAPGILAQLAKCQSLNAWEVAHALLRLAENPKVENPGALPVTGGEHWRERSRTGSHPHPPRRENQCYDCGRQLPCGCEHNSAKPSRAANDDTKLAALTAARQALASPVASRGGDGA